MSIKKFIKRIFCQHAGITINTTVNSTDPLLIISSIIRCNDCEKTFPQSNHPNCCCVAKIHNEIIRDLLINKMKEMSNVLPT